MLTKLKQQIPISLFLIILLALILRLLPLFIFTEPGDFNYSSTFQQSEFFGRYVEKKVFWYGEASSVFVASHGLGEITNLLSYNVHPPFYYFILHYWIKIFGNDEITLSFLSIIFNLLAIIAFYFFVKEIFKNKIYGLASALVLALVPLQVFFATRATSQSLTLLLAIISCLYLWRSVNNFSRKNVFFYVLSTLLLIYTFYPAFFLWAAQIAYILFFNFKYKKGQYFQWIFSQLLIFTLFLPQLLSIKSWSFFTSFEGMTHWQRKTLGLESFLSSAGYFFTDLIEIYWRHVDILSAVVFWVIFIIFIFKFKSLSRQKEFILILLLLTTLVLYVLNFYSIIRYFFAISFLWYLILTIVTLRKKFIFALLIIFLLILNFKFLKTENSEFYGRDLAQYIKDNERAGDIIVGDKIILDYYYTKKLKGEVPIYWFLGVPNKFKDDIYHKILFFGYDAVTPASFNRLTATVKPYNRVWFIMSMDFSWNDPDLLTVNWLNNNFELVDIYPAPVSDEAESLSFYYYDAYLFLFQKIY